jgi:PAS domain S-box-containing protein
LDFEAEVSLNQVLIQGQPYLLAVVRDISQQVAAETSLRRSEERFRRLSENAPDIIYTLDEKGAFTYVNPAWTRILGHAPEEVLGRYFVDFAPPGAAGKLTGLFKSIRDGHQTQHLIDELIHKDGGTRLFAMSGGPNLDDAGRVTGMVGMLKDVTEQARAQQALHASEERLRVALECAPDPVVIYDLEGRFQYLNPAFTRITGYSREEVIGQRANILRSGHHDNDFYQAMWQALNDSGRWQGEVWDRRKNGEVYPEWLSIRVVKDDAGNVANYVAVFSDIAERKAVEEHLKKGKSVAAICREYHVGKWRFGGGGPSTRRRSCQRRARRRGGGS